MAKAKLASIYWRDIYQLATTPTTTTTTIVYYSPARDILNSKADQKRPEERQIDKQCQPCRLLCDLNWTELIRWLRLT
uniref:Uncharacterized protein n=1 Tax=Oryza rufipogon TaxID=4529 RepID=A0A0E0QUY0_ORYRU